MEPLEVLIGLVVHAALFVAVVGAGLALLLAADWLLAAVRKGKAK